MQIQLKTVHAFVYNQHLSGHLEVAEAIELGDFRLIARVACIPVPRAYRLTWRTRAIPLIVLRVSVRTLMMV